MKTLALILLLLFFMSCNQNNKNSNNDLAMETPIIYNDLCFALDSIRFCEDKTDGFCPKLPLDVYFLNSKNGQFQNGYSSTLSSNIQPSFANFS